MIGDIIHKTAKVVKEKCILSSLPWEKEQPQNQI